eukprot:jgi/Bigna1/88978/estExt_fgenesh1_pg.C_410119
MNPAKKHGKSAESRAVGTRNRICEPRDCTPFPLHTPPDDRMLKGLEPKVFQRTIELREEELWQAFESLSAIPRPSNKEQKVLKWLASIAEEHKLEYKQDAAGNMVIYRPGTGRGENSAPIAIQGHVDMVTEKHQHVDHDFEKDGIKLMIEGDWVTAKGTTLGADNGIGVAAAIALLRMPRTASLPPLECLFTVDEETGLTGAKQLDGTLLSAKTMLNLDTEEWGSVYIGLDAGFEECGEGARSYKIRCDELKGGHSGIDINTGRANAVRLVSLVLLDMAKKLKGGIKLLDIKGGNKRNAIPRLCEAKFVLGGSDENYDTCRSIVDELAAGFRSEFGSVENNLRFTLEKEKNDSKSPKLSALNATTQRLISYKYALLFVPICDVITRDNPSSLSPSRLKISVANCTFKPGSLLCLLSNLPHGVLRMSQNIENLVETSSNMASVERKADSSVSLRRQKYRLGEFCGASVSQPEAYPGWNPNPKSKILGVTKACYKTMYGKDPEELAIHAGLECGMISDKCGGVDTVSFGPTITGAHSPDERVKISTVKPFFELVFS